jgi:hypothetical protein
MMAARGMTLVQAKEECERWFAYIKRQETKSIEMQKIAAARRSGEIDENEGRRRVRALDNCSVTVFDGARLEQAVRVLLKHVG